MHVPAATYKSPLHGRNRGNGFLTFALCMEDEGARAMGRYRDTDDRLWKAENLIALLGKMNLDRLPAHESRAVGECQAKAMDEWIAAYADLNGASTPARSSLQLS